MTTALRSGEAPGSVDALALAAIVNAYYPAVLAEPSTVRSRAQVAYTIASAIAGGLVTAGALAGISDLLPAVQVSGSLAVAAWLLAGALFMRVSKGVTVPRTPEGGMLTAEAFAQHAVDNTKREAAALEGRLDAAAKATWAALAFTGVALLGALLLDPPSTRISSRVVLSEEGKAALAGVCDGPAPETLEGEMDLRSLDDPYAVIEVARGDCRAEEPAVVRLQPGHILGLGSERS